MLHLAVKKKPIEIVDYLALDQKTEIARDVRKGLTQPQKSIPSKYFYDQKGSQLFHQICCTPEYYPTRTELSILSHAADDIMTFFAAGGGDLVELGSGANIKIRKLLDALPPSDLHRIRYVPVDISESSMIAATRELLDVYANLSVFGIIADFTRHLNMLPRGRKLIIFFGSTIGNFTQEEGHSFLSRVAHLMTGTDRFLVGIDMLKPVEVLEAAYNDRQGITSKFNLNLLQNINRALKADFNAADFEHLAFFNTSKRRIEMHLRARRNIKVTIADLALVVELKKGETIHTENCHKFTRESATRKFKTAGLRVARWFTDPQGWFSLVELKRALT
jgi:L-histidine Nalpha-methyltransferase